MPMLLREVEVPFNGCSWSHPFSEELPPQLCVQDKNLETEYRSRIQEINKHFRGDRSGLLLVIFIVVGVALLLPFVLLFVYLSFVSTSGVDFNAAYFFLFFTVAAPYALWRHLSKRSALIEEMLQTQNVALNYYGLTFVYTPQCCQCGSSTPLTLGILPNFAANQTGSYQNPFSVKLPSDSTVIEMQSAVSDSIN